jgi:glycosyltransferase involved in cell wall biosynthesis
MKKYFYKVSIIVRTRNEVQWISRCLNEIYNQKYKNFEVILVDHQSTDKTISLVKKNFPLVRIIKYNSKVFYPGMALNLGIKFSKGSLMRSVEECKNIFNALPIQSRFELLKLQNRAQYDLLVSISRKLYALGYQQNH